MAFSLKPFVMISLLLLSTWTVATMTVVMARPLSSTTSTMSLAARLRLEGQGEKNKCWETLILLQSCTGEIILFFLNGETHLGSGCCHALLTIVQECWPNMLTTLGLTTQEGDILRAYCDSIANINKSLPVPPSVTLSASQPMSHL